MSEDPPPPPPPDAGPPDLLGYQAPPTTDGMAIASLVMGILSITCVGFVATVLAVVFGVLSRRRITRSDGTLKGGRLAVAGIVLGLAALVLATVMPLVVS